MTRHVPNPDRPVEATTFRVAIDRLARRAVRESGGTKLRALADLRAAVERCIAEEAQKRNRYLDGTEDEAVELLDKMMGVHAGSKLTWREVGDERGVSAQAAHRRYGR